MVRFWTVRKTTEKSKDNEAGWQQGKGKQTQEWKATQKKNGIETNNQFDALKEGVVEEIETLKEGEVVEDPINTKEWVKEKFREKENSLLKEPNSSKNILDQSKDNTNMGERQHINGEGIVGTGTTNSAGTPSKMDGEKVPDSGSTNKEGGINHS